MDSSSATVRVRLHAASPRALRASVRKHGLDLCYGSVVHVGDGSAVEAFLPADRVTAVSAALASEGAHLTVLGPGAPETRPAVGEGDRFEEAAAVPHGVGVRRRR